MKIKKALFIFVALLLIGCSNRKISLNINDFIIDSKTPISSFNKYISTDTDRDTYELDNCTIFDDISGKLTIEIYTDDFINEINGDKDYIGTIKNINWESDSYSIDNYNKVLSNLKKQFPTYDNGEKLGIHNDNHIYFYIDKNFLLLSNINKGKSTISISYSPGYQYEFESMTE